MRFIEYILEQELGDADCNCPRCDHNSFRVLPPHPNYKDRGYCHRASCLWNPDAWDIIEELYPHCNYKQWVAVYQRHEQNYEASFPSADAASNGEAACSRCRRRIREFNRGEGRDWQLFAGVNELLATCGYWTHRRPGLELYYAAVIAAQRRIPLDQLVRRAVLSDLERRSVSDAKK